MTVSQATARALHKVDDAGGVLMLLTIAHPALSGPVHVVNDTRAVTSRGIEFIALPFTVTLPNDTSKEQPRARLQMDNVGRDMTLELEGLPPGAVLTATLQAVHRMTPDVIDYEFTSPLSGIRVDPLTLTATMGPDDIMRRPAVLIRFDKVTAPALFPGVSSAMTNGTMLQRAEAYVGHPYLEGEFDCADLAVLVQLQLFGREISLPSHRDRPAGARGQAREIRKWRGELADRIDAAETGCGVLMYELDGLGLPLWHIGTVFVGPVDTWVLHNSFALGCAWLQRLDDMCRQGMRLDGFYRWRTVQ